MKIDIGLFFLKYCRYCKTNMLRYEPRSWVYIWEYILRQLAIPMSILVAHLASIRSLRVVSLSSCPGMGASLIHKKRSNFIQIKVLNYCPQWLIIYFFNWRPVPLKIAPKIAGPLYVCPLPPPTLKAWLYISSLLIPKANFYYDYLVFVISGGSGSRAMSINMVAHRGNMQSYGVDIFLEPATYYWSAVSLNIDLNLKLIPKQLQPKK